MKEFLELKEILVIQIIHNHYLVKKNLVKEFQLVGSRKKAFSAVIPAHWNTLPPKVRLASFFWPSKKCQDLVLPIGMEVEEGYATLRVFGDMRMLSLPL